MSELPLEQWKQWARQDDIDFFVSSDIRQMVSEIEHLRREVDLLKELVKAYSTMAKP